MRHPTPSLTLTLLCTLLAAGCNVSSDDDDLSATPGTTSTPAPTSQVTPDPTPAPTSAPTPAPTAEPTPGPTPEPTPGPTPEPTPEPTPAPTPEPTPEPTPGPTADVSSTPASSPSPTPEPEASPGEEPSPTPDETPTAEPTQVSGKPSLDVSATVLNFGTINIYDEEPTTANVSLVNTGKADLTISSVDVVDDDNLVFSLQEDFIEVVLTPLNSITITVEFNPEIAGDFGANLEIHSNDPRNSVLFIILAGEGSEGTDEDGDGISLEESDCDDTNDAIYPGATEICDNLDNNCDDTIDEGFDSDSDGYTICAVPVADCDDTNSIYHPNQVEACDAYDFDCDGDTVDEFDFDGDGTADCIDDDGDGDMEFLGDCDDTNPEIHKDADEVCDGVDNNCDEDIDESSALDATLWYSDGDGDGYGDTLQEQTTACSAPKGYVDDNTDCDDADDSTHPSASEQCDGVDNNCDDVTDDGASCGACSVKYNDGRAYLFCPSRLTWSSARTQCYAYGYHMVTITSSSEDSWVITTAKSIKEDDWWIGLSDQDIEGSFEWEDGSKLSYTNWWSGQPDNYQNEDCATLVKDYGLKWGDGSCANTKNYICESLD